MLSGVAKSLTGSGTRFGDLRDLKRREVRVVVVTGRLRVFAPIEGSTPSRSREIFA